MIAIKPPNPIFKFLSQKTKMTGINKHSLFLKMSLACKEDILLSKLSKVKCSNILKYLVVILFFFVLLLIFIIFESVFHLYIQCFNGDVAIVDPSTTPFTLEPLGTNDCQDMYRAYLKPTGPPIGDDPFTFQVIH